MKYLGGKARIASKLLNIILSERVDDQYYIEPFLGGANSMQGVKGNRLGGELNPYIADMWQELLEGWIPPKHITKDLYLDIKSNPEKYENYLVGYVGINCSYSGKWFGGYAGVTKTKTGLRDYQDEAFRNVMKQVEKLKGLEVFKGSYQDLPIPQDSIIYCDPPYEGTTKYANDFDSNSFWDWCRVKHGEGHKVYVSEYSAPSDFNCVWSQEVKSSLSANGVSGSSKKSIEKLFTLL